MARRYRIIASPDLLQVDYNLLADEDLNTTRYSVDGQWAIIEYKEGIELDFPTWNNDEACEYLEANYDEWNEPSIPE